MAVLREVKFEVTLVEDADHAQLFGAIESFGRRCRRYEAGRCNIGRMEKLSFRVTVVMERYPTHNRWNSVQWRVVEVLPDEGTYTGPTAIDNAPDALPGTLRMAHPGYELGIFRDEAEGYYLNVQAPEPAIFAIWRFNEDETEAIPHSVTLSYNEAARRMDAQEKVDRVAMPPELFEMLSAWVAANYEPPKKKQRIRPESFKSKEGRYKSGM